MSDIWANAEKFLSSQLDEHGKAQKAIQKRDRVARNDTGEKIT